MSVIICAATSDFGIMMADSRLTENGVPTNENYQKIWKINDQMIFGSGGSASLGKMILEQVILPDDYVGCDNDTIFKDAYTKCSEILNEYPYDDDLSSYLFFLENTMNHVWIRIIQIIGKEISTRVIHSDSPETFVYAIGSNGYKENIQSIIESHLPDLLTGLCESIEYISTIDNTVNNITRFFATRVCEKFNVKSLVG